MCCAIIGVDPMTVDHIRLARAHGFGTTELSQIAITGDVSLAEAQQRARGLLQESNDASGGFLRYYITRYVE